MMDYSPDVDSFTPVPHSLGHIAVPSSEAISPGVSAPNQRPYPFEVLLHLDNQSDVVFPSVDKDTPAVSYCSYPRLPHDETPTAGDEKPPVPI